ncbi:hypothetical protein AB0M80_18495 [Amycolatopsis sp. NPDC051045]|uniref:hypothetical protein n=1 Tax=Amycolatopsis sp. NPDC051045 TaxID=3156922 RepID=UPI00341E5D7A
MSEGDSTPTRRSLHGVAELLLAGPEHRATGRIDLRVTDGGFATTAGPALRVEGDELVTGSARVRLAGRTYADVAAEAGIEAGEPAGVYTGGPGIAPAERITWESKALALLLQAFADGDRALREFAPDAVPVLWPEHFDVAITVDEVNYGVSPGDGYLGEPYAYVGPHEPRRGEFWNAPFGAARPLRDLGGAVTAFFRTGREHL